MTIEEVATHLNDILRKQYGNGIQAVGIRGNNVEAYDANPQMFAERVTEDSIIVYTTNKPLPAQLALAEYDGYKIEWKESGEFTIQ